MLTGVGGPLSALGSEVPGRVVLGGIRKAAECDPGEKPASSSSTVPTSAPARVPAWLPSVIRPVSQINPSSQSLHGV